MKKLVLAGLLVLLLVPLASSAQPSVTLRTFSDETCPTGSAKYAVDITNPGSSRDTFGIRVNAPGSTVAPESVTLGPGETDSAFIWIQPSRNVNPGTYNFNVVVTSENSGDSTTRQGSLEVLSCRNVELSPEVDSRSVCRNEDAVYSIEVSNEGEVEETYRLRSSSGSLSRSRVTLEPGDSTSVDLTVSSSRAGQREITVSAESTSSYARDSKTLLFEARECRSFDLFLSPSERSVCGGETGEFTLTIENTGSIGDTYTVLSNSRLSGSGRVTLSPGESRSFTVRADRNVGEHTVVARASSTTLSSLSLTRDSALVVENCYDLEVSSGDGNNVRVGKEEAKLLTLTLENTGTRDNSYSIELEGPEWLDVRPRDLDIGAGESRDAFLYVAPDFFAERGNYEASLTFTSGEGDVRERRNIGLFVGNGTVRVGDGRVRGSITNYFDDITSDTAGTTALVISVLVLLIIGYWYFRQSPEVDTSQERDFHRSADDYLDQNTNTVISSLRRDNLSKRFLGILLEEEREAKNRQRVINELERQLGRKR